MDLEPLPPEGPWSSPTEPSPIPPVPSRRWSARTRVIAAVAGVTMVGAASFAISALNGTGGSPQITTAAAHAAAGTTPATPTPTSRIHGAALGSVSGLSGSAFTVTSMFAATTRTTKVATSSATAFTRTEIGKVGDIKVGNWIAAMGSRAADGSLTATGIAILPAGLTGGPKAGPKKTPPTSPAAGAPSRPFALGTVESISGGVITVTTPRGSDKITTASNPTVVETVAATLKAVTDGAMVAVGGRPSADGATLDATRVDVIDPAVAALGKSLIGGIKGFGGGLGAGFGGRFGRTGRIPGPGGMFGHRRGAATGGAAVAPAG